MIGSQTPKVNKKYTVEKFDDEILLYMETGTQAVYLNDAAHAVWLLCQEEMTVEQIIEYLQQVYPGQEVKIKEDVIIALTTLQSHNVIELSNVG